MPWRCNQSSTAHSFAVVVRRDNYHLFQGCRKVSNCMFSSGTFLFRIVSWLLNWIHASLNSLLCFTQFFFLYPWYCFISFFFWTYYCSILAFGSLLGYFIILCKIYEAYSQHFTWCLYLWQETDLLDITYVKDARTGKCTKTPKVSISNQCYDHLYLFFFWIYFPNSLHSVTSTTLLKSRLTYFTCCISCLLI